MEAPAGEDSLYVAEKGGTVRALRAGNLDPAPVLDISSEVSTGFEQGLLGLAISPDRRYLYVNFTNRDGDTRIREYAMAGGRADPGSARDVLAIDQPFANHNGGHLAFGPDGKLWIGLGDGGSSGDPAGNAQSLDTLLGKMLRINPRPSGGRDYGIPSDNPFVGKSGARGEIWAYGLRNPWRYSFDRSTGDLYIADVGQNAWEEVNFRSAASKGGENYGWDRLEGTHRFEGDPPPGHVPPVYEYSLKEGCAVTGGYVYRGSRIPALQGAYLFADFCQGTIRAFAQRRGRAEGHRFLGPKVDQLSSFGQDQSGELYAMSLGGDIFRIDPA
ncbi:MAG TPA: PQQ-dependent sugar dehydrogenase [Actinomycetota bacterium]|nr:PQQ-dependent sugar dehydrogenase [Actinomycetota bacterium]